MSKSKYINTFETTADYENYIESALPEFPNVGYDKEAGEVKIMRTSPNSHVFYGTLNDNTIQPIFRLIKDNSIVKEYNLTVDSLNNTFYLDDWGTIPAFNTLNEYSFFYGFKNKVTSLKKFYMNTSNVTNMNSMFSSSSSLTSLDLSGFNTSNVTNMSSMFESCSSLTSLDLSGFNTSNVTDMNSMFYNCSSLTSLDLSGFNTSNVTNMTNMFNKCSSLTSLVLSNWDISNLKNMTNMFISCSSLRDVYINVEATLMKLTNNLTSQNYNYIPSSATIHYNNGTGNVDYKWQNNAWTPQS